MKHLRPRLSASGRSLAPALIIVAGLVVSGLIFFYYTRPRLAEPGRPGAAVTPGAASTAPGAAGTPAGDPGAAGTAPDATTAGAAGSPGTPEGALPSGIVPADGTAHGAAAPALPGFARPLDLGTQITKALGSGDFASAAKLASAADPSQAAGAEAVLKKIFGTMGFKPGPEDKVQILGQVGDSTRIAIPLLKPGETASTLRLELDVERDAKMGWKITQFHLPKELASAIADMPPATVPEVAVGSTPGSMPIPGQAGAPAAPGKPASAPPAGKPASLFAVQALQDPLSFSSDFVRVLLHHDFLEARKFIDEAKVPKEKLAGLCIVFEEGQYELKPSKPLIITVANPEVSWVIAQVQSEKLQEVTEFGLELQRSGVDQPWRIVGLNLSEILGSFAQSASKIGVPYTPIVKNPKGGESLALYFEYDRAELHPRAKKQIEIVAGLLKADPSKKLKIAGHTDAMGADDYNIRLSLGRAEEVKKSLVALGVSADQIITEALGKAQPLSPNQKADGTDDPEGRSKNRRAEIYLDF